MVGPSYRSDPAHFTTSLHQKITVEVPTSSAILMASRRPRLYTAHDRESDRLTTNNESDKARYEWIQGT